MSQARQKNKQSTSDFNSPGFRVAEPSRTRSVGVERNAPAPARQEESGGDASLTPSRLPNNDRGDNDVTPSRPFVSETTVRSKESGSNPWRTMKRANGSPAAPSTTALTRIQT